MSCLPTASCHQSGQKIPQNKGELLNKSKQNHVNPHLRFHRDSTCFTWACSSKRWKHVNIWKCLMFLPGVVENTVPSNLEKNSWSTTYLQELLPSPRQSASFTKSSCYEGLHHVGYPFFQCMFMANLMDLWCFPPFQSFQVPLWPARTSEGVPARTKAPHVRGVKVWTKANKDTRSTRPMKHMR